MSSYSLLLASTLLLGITTGQDYSLPGPVEIFQNNLLTTLPDMGVQFSISFEFKPTKYISATDQAGPLSGYTDVLHFTTGANVDIYGSRIPAIFINKDKGSLLIIAAINGNNNYVVYEGSLPPLNVWTKFVISQKVEFGEYVFRVIIDGIEHPPSPISNSQPGGHSDVKVYASDPFYTAQPGSLKNIQVLQFGEDDGTCCHEKQVGDVDYTLVKEYEPGTYPANCLSGCAYKVTGSQGGMLYCFAQGLLPVFCEDQKPVALADGRSDVLIFVDDDFEFYADGIFIKYGSDIPVAKVFNLTNVETQKLLAVKGRNDGGPEGIILSTSEGIVTDTTWKCHSGDSPPPPANWFTPACGQPCDSFDDAVISKTIANPPGFNPFAKYIWGAGQNPVPKVVYCRKTL